MPRYRTSFFINPAESEGFLRNPNKLPLAIIVRAKRDKNPPRRGVRRPSKGFEGTERLRRPPRKP